MAPNATTKSARNAAPEQEETKAAPVEEAKATSRNDAFTADQLRDLRTKAYSAGSKRLREENRDAFKKLVIEEADKLGIDYVFSPTPEEKALAQAEALFAAHPGLREALAAQGK